VVYARTENRNARTLAGRHSRSARLPGERIRTDSPQPSAGWWDGPARCRDYSSRRSALRQTAGTDGNLRIVVPEGGIEPP
jgi:hypothetical protein